MENYVVILYEHAQKTQSKLRYEEVGCVGPDHIKTWVPAFVWWHVHLQSLGNLADVFFSAVCLGPWKIESQHWNFVDLYNQPPVQ